MADPATEAALSRIEAYAGGHASVTSTNPETEAALQRIESFAQRSTPSPSAPIGPPPAPPGSSPLQYHRNPNVAVSPSGRVIDPATGQPFPPRGQADPNADPGQMAGMLEGANPVLGSPAAGAYSRVTLKVANPALRVMAWFLNPVQEGVHQFFVGQQKGQDVYDRAHPPQSFSDLFAPGRLASGYGTAFSNVASHGKEIARAAIQPGMARVSEDNLFNPERYSMFKGTPLEMKPGSTAMRVTSGAMGLAADTGTDLLGGELQSRLVGGGSRIAGGALGKAGAYDAPIPGIGKSVNELAAGAQDVNKVHQYFGAAAGRSGEIQREAAGFVQRASQRTATLKQMGVDVKGVGEGSGQAVNKVDELVSHYIEAGSGPRAKFESQADVLESAAQMGKTPEQVKAIQQYVVETAKDYVTSWNKTGRALEGVGFLKPGTVDKLGASYVPGMYHATSGNPQDIETWLKAADSIGGVNPKAVGMAENLLANDRGGFANAGKSRTLDTWQQRVEHGGEFQASPVFAKSIKSGTNIAAKGSALQDIAADPSLVAQTYSPGKLQLSGRQYGQAEGLFVQPRTKAAIDGLIAPNPQDLGAVAPLLRAWRNSVVAGSLPMIVHHTKYVAAMTEGRLAQEGVAGLTPVDLATAIKERAAYVTGGAASPAVDALSKNTRAFVPQTGVMNDLASSLRKGLGVNQGAGASLLTGTEKAANATRKFIGGAEQTFKIAMTKKLMLKYSPEEAAQIAQETISGTGPAGKAISTIERLGIVPFITSKARSAPKIAAIAATRPDILMRYSGVNEARALGTALGPDVQRRQQLADNPEEAIPVPGVKDRYGRQIFLNQSPFALNPIGDLPRAVTQGFLGAAGKGMLALGNAHQTPQGIQPLSKPGELPPWEKVMKQVEYGLPIGGTIGRGVQRIGQAVRGETSGGGPFREPETVGQAILGTALGAQTSVPETEREGQQRAAANVARSAPWQKYAQDYQRLVDSGVVKVDRSPALDKITKPFDAANQMKASYMRLQQLVTGQEGSYAMQDRAARIRNQLNWFLSLESRFHELSGRQLQLEDLRAAR